MSKLFALLGILLLATPIAAIADAAKFTISEVEYDDPITPGEAMLVEMTLSNIDAIYNVESLDIKAWLENNFNEKVTEKAIRSDVKVYASAEKELTLTVQVPEDLEAGEYNLIITAVGKWARIKDKVSATAERTVTVEQNDDALYISEVKLTKPRFDAAEAVDVAVTVMNNGREDQENVKVAIAIPGLDIQKSYALFGTLYAGTAQTVYFTFDLPEDAAAGIHTLKATASNRIAKTTSETDLFVEAPEVVDTSEITATTVSKSLKAGKTSELKLLVTNKGSETKDYLVTARSEDMLVTLQPASFSLGAGQAKTVSVEMTAESAGEQTADIAIAENGAVISAIKVNADVAGSFTWVTAIFIVLVAIIVILVVYSQFRPETSGGQQKKTIYY